MFNLKKIFNICEDKEEWVDIWYFCPTVETPIDFVYSMATYMFPNTIDQYAWKGVIVSKKNFDKLKPEYQKYFHYLGMYDLYDKELCKELDINITNAMTKKFVKNSEVAK